MLLICQHFPFGNALVPLPLRRGSFHIRPRSLAYTSPLPFTKQTKKPYPFRDRACKRSRHLPIFTGRFQPTIFGTSELNFCVRNGNRWNLTVIDTGQRMTIVMLLSLSRITLSCYPVKGCTLKTEYRTAFANRVSDQDGVKPSTY